MKKWYLEYWVNENGKSPIEKWLYKLTVEQFKSVSQELRILEKLGNELKLPHSRALSKGLFELRERQFGYRLYYCFKENQLIILLAAGNKKSQKKDIKIAYKRLLENTYYENKEILRHIRKKTYKRRDYCNRTTSTT